MRSADSEEARKVVERRITALLEPNFTDLFRVSYYPSFPNPDGSTQSIFQVVFEVGPGEDVAVRDAVHERFQQLLRLLAHIAEVQQSKVAFRARRHIPPHSRPDWPHMFIECAWHGLELLSMRDDDFSSWRSRCYYYINRFDPTDPLNKVT